MINVKRLRVVKSPNFFIRNIEVEIDYYPKNIRRSGSDSDQDLRENARKFVHAKISTNKVSPMGAYILLYIVVHVWVHCPKA